jgi:two-component system NtrC family sensor kinase
MGIASLRRKFLVILLAMFMAVGGTFLFNGYTLIRSIVLREANDYVESASRVTWSEYDHRITELQLVLQLIGSKILLIDALKQGDDTTITARLNALMEHHHLDFMTVLNRDGSVFTRARPPHHRGDPAHRDGIITDALRGREVSGTVLIPLEVLELEGAGLVDKVQIDTVPTPMSKRAASRRLNAGMALKAAVPVWDGSQQIGVVYGGVLLNHNDALVDKIQQTIFLAQTHDGRPLGSVTIFQGDARIATTLKSATGARAVGTTVSSEVYDQVLEKGQPWLGRAFVVDDWYLAAYEPIYDPLQNIIGILFVGVLERKFSDYQQALLGQFAIAGMTGTLAALALFYILLSRVVRPINRLAHAAEQVSEGRFPEVVPEERQFREVYHLTRAFNSMVQQIQERNERLGQMNEDLKRQNKSYMELLGFVVHELKTPINSITFGLSSMMAQSVGQLNEKQKKLADIIMRNASYLNAMIRNYLDLSRIEKGELAISPSRVLLEEDVIEPIKYQLGPQLAAARITVFDQVPVGVEVEADLSLLRVVMNNLLGNATKYGAADSQIQIQFEELGEWIQVGVWNEGPGVPAANVPQLFNKFTDFVSKDRTGRKGTGLGLFITREIIEKHGGTVWAEGEEGKWIRFSFRIPKRMGRYPPAEGGHRAG